jgi:hypothetical protein
VAHDLCRRRGAVTRTSSPTVATQGTADHDAPIGIRCWLSSLRR